MATLYSDVYDVFANSKITDGTLASMLQEVAEMTMFRYLKSSIAVFTECKQDLSDRDDSAETFNIDLTDLEIEILATYMVVAWLTPTLNSGDLVKQSLVDKDFRRYSQANHLNSLMELRDLMRDEASALITRYVNSGLEIDDFAG